MDDSDDAIRKRADDAIAALHKDQSPANLAAVGAVGAELCLREMLNGTLIFPRPLSLGENALRLVDFLRFIEAVRDEADYRARQVLGFAPEREPLGLPEQNPEAMSDEELRAMTEAFIADRHALNGAPRLFTHESPIVHTTADDAEFIDPVLSDRYGSPQ